ncbi:MAG TPA: glycoside hydrolase domain-containing protein [Phycisphaerae bacterium]|nr:glycoside hydrolase domain-containing protein [Phycisphaerae bacterium]
MTTRRAVALTLLAGLCTCAVAQDVTVLSDNDIGRAEDMTTPGRWGQPASQDGRTSRTYPGPQSLSYVGIKPWFDGQAPDADAMVRITYRDTTTRSVGVLVWNGAGQTYGYTAIGRIGGANDGAWKQACILCPRSLIRRRPGAKPDNVCWMLFNGGGKVDVDRIELLAPSPDLLAQSVTEARAARARSVEALLKTFQHVPWKETTPLGEVDEAFQALGFIPYARSYTVDVRPGSIPTPTERGLHPLKSYATAGEFEPILAAAYALKDLTFAAAVSDLKGPGTLRAGRDVTVRWVESAPLRIGSSWGKSYQVMNCWLRTNGPLAVKGHTSQSWLISVHVPADAAAGVYRGTFTLSAGGKKAAFPIEFRVLPFTLDRADHIARGPYTPGVLSDEHIQDLLDHGHNSMSLWSGQGIKPKMAGGRCVADVSADLDAYLRKLKRGGFVRAIQFGGGDPAYNNPNDVASVCGGAPGTDKFAKAYGQFWQDIRRLEAENGWPEIICCPFDEPVKSQAKTRNYLLCYDIVKQAAPTTKVFCVFMNKTWAAGQLGTKADIWSCNGAFEANQAEKLRLAAEENDHRLFYTYTGAMASTRPGDARFNTGILPWHHDVDGTFCWAYLWTSEDPFNDLDGGARDWSPVARDVDGVLYGSIGWEGYREGIDDQRYIQTCMRLAREKGRKDVLATLEEMKKAVKKGRENPESVRTAGLDDFFFRVDDADFMDLYRARVVAMILEMIGKG